MVAKHDILIVEDEPVVVLAAKRMLIPAGLHVDHAETVAEGRRKASSHEFRLNLVDLMLPDGSGFDLVSTLRESNPESPIIVVTGYATAESAIACFKAGVFDFVAKPFEIDELLGSVQRALRFQKSANAQTRQFAVSAENIECYGLGEHAQVRLQPSGPATITLGVTFPTFMGNILDMELPEVGTMILQGNACARIHNDLGEIHIVRAPLTGSVVEINHQLLENTKLLDTDAYGLGWFARILPTQVQTELQHLTSFAKC